ncbi:uncharacterized protein LOC135488174 [Lineus longissimus]|uniref:uncharacterized protein LOC135488174 n=1 Tax=Lineus longissimus TaxID=88925 RepID=UPI002B4E836B
MEKFTLVNGSTDLKNVSKDSVSDSASSGNDDENCRSPSTMKSTQGVKLWLAVMLIIGEMAGTGVLSLPRAVVNCGGPLGIVLLLFLGGVAAYTGITLGWCWQILEERFEEYRTHHVQDPYNAIGYRAAGNAGRYIVSVCNGVANFSAGIVLLLLSSEMVHGLLVDLLPDMSMCLWMVVIAILLIPMSWIGTPKDMWFIAVGATLSTALACVLVLSNILLLIPKTSRIVKRSDVELKPFLSAFGIITFAFCGHMVFPTIQHDMVDGKKFSWAIILGFSGMLTMFVPVALAAYTVLGDAVSDNVLTVVQRLDHDGSEAGITTAVQVLLTCHLVLGFHIILNPLHQELEKLFKVKNEFCFRRVLVRSCLVVLVLFLCETIPKFGPIMSFIGGSFINMIVFLLPPVFYELLCRGDERFPKIAVPLHIRVIHVEILLIGVLAGGASCYSAVNEIFAPGSFVMPCYINVTIGQIK